MRKSIKFGIATVPQQRARSLAIVAGTRTVARGEPKVWFPSLSAVANVLSDENVELLRSIRKDNPDSVDALARAVGKQAPEVMRALRAMEMCGLVKLKKNGEAIVPLAPIERVTVELA
jgi:predicted transcriptional regulator